MHLPSLTKSHLLKPKLTTSLIILGCFFSVLAVFFPQLSTQTPGYFANLADKHPLFYKIVTLLSLNNIFSSLWFYIFVSFAGVILFLSFWDQIFRILKKNVPVDQLPFQQCIEIQHDPEKQYQNIIKKICQQHNYSLADRLTVDNDQYIVFKKGWLGVWGTPVLHGGLILLILAGIYGAAFYSRGFVQIISGETVAGKSHDWLESKSGFLSDTLNTKFSFKLNDFILELWPDKTIKKMQSVLEIRQADTETSTTITPELGSPAIFNGITILQAPHFGYAVSFVLKPDNLPGIPTSFMLDKRLKNTSPPSVSSNYPLTELQFDITLYNDNTAKIYQIKDPQVSLSVIDDENSVLFMGDMQIGNKVRFGKYDLYLTDIQFWSGITAISGYGIPLVYLSFLLIFIGSTLHYLFIPTKIYFKIKSTGDTVFISLYGRSYSKVYSIKDDLDNISVAIQQS